MQHHVFPSWAVKFPLLHSLRIPKDMDRLSVVPLQREISTILHGVGNIVPLAQNEKLANYILLCPCRNCEVELVAD
jgi:hypothetical protein